MTKKGKKTFIEYQKRFVNGEQYLRINSHGDIITDEKFYYWQQREVYNHIKGIIDYYCKDIDENLIYGENGLVARLIPYQKAYNAIKNMELEYINRVTTGIIYVEDGSVDTDNLEEEGLSPGKILVYRQGSEKPLYSTAELNTKSYIDSENDCLQKMCNITKEFVKTIQR